MNKQKINPEVLGTPPAPFSSVIVADEVKKLIFLSGISATDETGRIVGKGDILMQTKKIIENIQAGLEALGASKENIVRTNTYVLGNAMDDFFRTGACDVLLEELDNPTDTLIGVASLAGMKYGALIEVTVTAAI